MKEFSLSKVKEEETYGRKKVTGEINALYTVMENIIDSYEELKKKKIELDSKGEDLTFEEIGEYKILEHLCKTYYMYS